MSDITPKYYNEFSCLGEKCSETCCQGWVISIDKSTYDKYQDTKHNMFKNNPNFSEMPEPTDNFHGIIKMKKNGFCPFLNENNLCKIQNSFGEKYLSNTCKTFPRRNVKYSEFQNVRTLSMACPEAARLCLTEKDSMKIFEDKIYEKKNYINLVPKELRDSYNSVGEKLFNKIFFLLKDHKFPLINILLITEKLLNEQNFLVNNQDKLEKTVDDLLKVFKDMKIVDFDNSLLKLSFLDEIFKFIDNLNYDNKSNEKFKIIITQAYNELIGRFINIDDAQKNFNKANNILNEFDEKNKVYRKFLQNEIFSHAQIFTNNTPFCRNRFYITIFCTIISKLITISKISSSNNKIHLNDLIESIQKVSKYHGFFLNFYKNMEYKFNDRVYEILTKIDKNNIFNSLLFLYD